MSEPINPKAESQGKESPLSLDAFKDFTFSTAWSAAPRSEPRSESPGSFHRRPPAGGSRPDRRPAGNFNRGPGAPRSDRSPQDRRPTPTSGGASRAEQPGRPRFERPARPDYRPFRPVVEVLFYPEETPFQALIQALRTSGRTYPLFDIATLILEKPDRFVAVVNALKKGEGEAAVPFYISVPDGLPFETEESALSHVFQHHLQGFFDREEMEGEAPKGAFSFVYKCPCTGDLITPPNYHKAQALLHEHHALHHAALSFEQFQHRLEKASEPEAIQSWLQKMSRQVTYRLKGAPADGPSFDTLDGARHYLLTHAKARLVKAAKTARLSGKHVESLPVASIRQSIETVLVRERRFPLETVNHLRGRLRRLHFSLFKRSGIAYISAVKRRLRTPGLEFAASIQGLVNFLEGKDGLLAHQLPEQYLGIAVPSKGEALEGEVDQRLKALMQDLHWLIREGYVTEFNDGRLALSPLANAPEAFESEGERPKTAASQKDIPSTLESVPDGLTAEDTSCDSANDDDDTAFSLESPTGEPAEDRPGLDEEI